MITLKLTKAEVEQVLIEIEEKTGIEGDEFQIVLQDSAQILRVEIVCDVCLGEGEVSTDVGDGEGHTMRGVGSQPCWKCKEGPDHDPDAND